MAVRDQFAINVWLAQGDFEKTRNAMHTAAARTGHAIECVRDAPHAAVESRACLFLPCITVTAAHGDAAGVKLFNCLQGAGQLRRECDSLYDVAVFEQLLDRRR